MFDKINTLGSGAFGEVFKVKSLTSTKICDNGNDRVLLTQAAIKKLKIEMTRSNMNAKAMPNQGRTMLQDNFYVIKEIDVANVPEKIGNEAL